MTEVIISERRIESINATIAATTATTTATNTADHPSVDISGIAIDVSDKEAVQAVATAQSLNMEECVNGIRASTILPGEVATPIMQSRAVPPSPEELAKMLQPEQVAQAVLFVAQMPPSVCVNEILISPTWNRSYPSVQTMSR